MATNRNRPGALAKSIQADIDRAIRRIRTRIRDRGVEIMREEVPSQSGYLRDRVKGTVSRDGEVSIFVQAFTHDTATTGTLILPSGKRKQVPLRGAKPFNYAKAVQEGTGLFGPKGELIRPNRAKAMLIEVDSPPSDEPYIIARGKFYIFRQSSKGMRPNDYVGRTYKRLDPEIAKIISQEMAKVGAK
jgi:hypothetical protein